MNDREPDFLLFSHVPISDSTDIAEAHVVGVNLAILFPVDLDVTADEVLRFHAVLTWLILANDSVSLISEGQFASQLVTKVSHENIEDVVSSVVKSDFATVFESDLFEARGNKSGACHSDFDVVLGPTVKSVVVIWSINEEVTDGRMMADLLHVDVSTILPPCLECLTKNGIQRLLKDLLLVEETHGVSNHKLHPFEWVVGHCSAIQKHWHRTLKGWLELESGKRRHALDWETDLGQIEIA